jgi:hypothetical protein
MSDYKYEMQMRAEELAEMETGMDFYDLPASKQDALFSRASEDWITAKQLEAESRED